MPKAPESNAQPDKLPSNLRMFAAFASFLATFAVLLFLPAGRLDWAAGWIYLAILALSAAVNYLYLRRRNPELIAHRMRFGKGTKTWDKIWMVLFTPAIAGVYLVAGLDAGRFAWSAMPLPFWALGLALFLAGALLLMWSMGANPFFEKTVRIQKERGHRVIDTGPYRLVRHPGYLAFFGWIVSAPLLLGSWWALLPAALSLVLVVARTALEDRTLREELPGYLDYARRVRFRLIPKLW